MKHYPANRDQKLDQLFARATFIAVWVVLAFSVFGLIVTLAPIWRSAREVLAAGIFGRAFICAALAFTPTIFIAPKFIEQVEWIDTPD